MAAPGVAPPAAAVVKKTKAGLMNPKTLILSALMGVLTAALVVTAVFVVLRPAHIYFSVTDASSDHSSSGSGGGSPTRLTLNLVANNSSPRTTVDYHSLFVDVKNNTGPLMLNWVRAKTNTAAAAASGLLLQQRPRNVTTIVASVAMLQGVWDDANFPANEPSKPFTVVVTALVRFRVGFAKTHMYDIKVTCSPVSFVPSSSNNPKSTKQGAKQRAAAAAAAPAPQSAAAGPAPLPPAVVYCA